MYWCLFNTQWIWYNLIRTQWGRASRDPHTVSNSRLLDFRQVLVNCPVMRWGWLGYCSILIEEYLKTELLALWINIITNQKMFIPLSLSSLFPNLWNRSGTCYTTISCPYASIFPVCIFQLTFGLRKLTILLTLIKCTWCLWLNMF